MKKIVTGACILAVTFMFSPAMAQDSPKEQMNRQGNRFNTHINRQGDQYGNRRIDRGRDHWRGQGSTRFANPRGHRTDQRYSRYNNRHNRHMDSRLYNRRNRHMYSRFHNRYQRHMYSMRNRWQYRHRNN